MEKIVLLGVVFLISGDTMVANKENPNYTLGDLISENGYEYNVDENNNVNLCRKVFLEELLKEETGVMFDFAEESYEIPESTEEEETEAEAEQDVSPEVLDAYLTYSNWNGPKLNRSNGTVNGPSGKETYYNLNMNGVISLMRSLGYSSPEYDYWVREDGVKMFGPYIMCAADLNIRPKGTIIPTSLGVAMVCDTGSFANSNHYQLDIAVAW